MQKDYVAHIQRVRSAPKRTLLGIVVMLISGVVGGMILHQDNARVSALQVKRDIAAGSSLSANDFHQVWIPQIESDVPRIEHVDEIAGQFAAHTLLSGSLLRPADLVDSITPRTTVALEIPLTRLPPQISVGSDIELWQVGEGSARLLKSRVQVADVRANERSDSVTISVELNPVDVSAVLGAGDSVYLALLR